jgi:glyoxylase-like metal-dependent hydrolase (beta-lactamase superfamily II)
VVPYRITTELPGVFQAEAACTEVTPGAPLDASMLAVPEGVRPDPRASTSGKHSVEPFPGIHHLVNVVPGYNMLWVEQEDGVYVIEAPDGPGTSEEVLADVAARAPGKPVRGFVLTHFHYDHSAGLWTYIERGIPIWTTQGVRDFVEEVAAAPRTLAGVREARKPVMEMVEGRRMIGSGPNRFELIDAGPNPHAEQILIVYFPERKLLYVPDIYGYYPGFTPPPLLQSFADRLDALNLDIRTVLTAHTDPDSIEGMQRMIRQVRGGR